jgi:hypothetical protein
MGHGIYIASRTRHAARWRALRASGVPIISTWIYEAGEGETSDWAELWERCVREASSCRGLILFAEPPEDDCLSGALVEAGVALGAGVPVYVVGESKSIRKFVRHPLVKRCSTVEEAIEEIGRYLEL